MEKALLIAEKPDLMRKIKAVYDAHKSELNYHIDFVAQVGHLVCLMTPKEISEEKYGKWTLSEYPTIYPYQYKVKENTADVFSNIKKTYDAGNYDYIIHAGDPDQEGELLVRLVLNKIGNKKPVKRFWTNDLSENSILHALKNLKDDNEYNSLFNSAIVRQHTDYQFGMNFTAVATLMMNDLCKLGRVKGYIVYAIAKKEDEVKNYVETKTYKPAFSYQGLEFVNPEGKQTESEAKGLNPNTNKAIVTEVKVEKKTKKPDKLFKLSTLQMAAFKSLKMSDKKTLEVLQSLYEKRAVSYPRTDCEYISTETDVEKIKNKIIGSFAITPEVMTKSSADILKDKSYCNDKAIASEGHTAIIPTGESASMTEDEKALYELICRRFLAIFAENKVTLHTKVTATPENSSLPYEYTEKSDVTPGFEFIINPQYETVKPSGVSFTKDMVLTPIEFFVKECVSTPPTRYNVASLIKALDNPENYSDEDGEKIKYAIGTPATRANIINECIENGYISVSGKGVYSATNKAMLVIQNYKDMPIFNPTESAKWEAFLIKIRNGELSAKDTQDELMKELTDAITKMKSLQVTPLKERAGGGKVLGKCPNCGHEIVSGKFGAYCSNKCGMLVSKAMGKPLTDKQVEDILAGKKVLMKGLKSAKGTYDAYVTLAGTSPFNYQKQDGTYAKGIGFKFDMTFPKKGKK